MESRITKLMVVLFSVILLCARLGFSYDPTIEPAFKGPEEVSGADEPSIPGGAFNMEKYALCEGGGMFIDGVRTSSVLHNIEATPVRFQGRTYLADKILECIFVIDGDRLYKLAGSGVGGDKDGPAETAEFRFGVYYEAIGGMAFAGNGDIFIADNKNYKIKKLYKDNTGRWMVKTVAGGGKKYLKVGDSCNALEAGFNTTGNPSIRGADKDQLYFVSGRFDWEYRYILYPNGKLWCVGYNQNSADLPASIDTSQLKGYEYKWFAESNRCTVWKRARAIDSPFVKIVGYTQSEQDSVKKANPSWVLPIDGPVNDCSFWTTGGPMRPDGRAIYTCGGDELLIRRIMNGRVMTLSAATGQWVESRYSYIKMFGTACPFFYDLDWDGYGYMGYSYGGSGLWRAKLYNPLVKPINE